MTNEDLEFFTRICGGDITVGFGEDYNKYCFEQAIEISKSLRSKEEIISFTKKSWDEQKSLVPNLDDGHSGNTFGMSCRLAIAYLPMLREEKIDSIINEK